MAASQGAGANHPARHHAPYAPRTLRAIHSTFSAVRRMLLVAPDGRAYLVETGNSFMEFLEHSVVNQPERC
jgi:hypothetical protein